MTLAEVADAVGGTPRGEATVTAPAAVDSRVVEPGGLFVAVAGEHVDGHDYATAAVAAGAAAVLAGRPLDVPCVVVDDTVAALGRLAAHLVDRLDEVTVLALTGSQGKTGTKDYLAQVLATAGDTVATAGNFNNEIGVPLTVLRATSETRFLVVEMGARGLGHIRELCRIARPRVAAVLNVGTAHLSEFGTREAIAEAKGEIVEGLPADGVAVLNADDPLVRDMAHRTRARVVTFGTDPVADVSFTEPVLDDLGRPASTLTTEDGRADVVLRQSGAHQVANAAAAAAMALAAGLDLGAVAGALQAATSRSRWRMELTERADGTVVVNDAYNANPASMRAAIDTVTGIARRRATRAVAVLGEMKELGADSDAEHRQIGAAAARAAVDVLVAVGDAGERLAEGAEATPDWAGTAIRVPDREQALAWLRQHVAPRDVVLVKASRGVALETVADGLIEAEGNTG